MSGEIDRIREELEKTRRICDDLRADNLLKEEKIRKLTMELKAADTTCKYFYTGTIGHHGAGQIYRRELDMDFLRIKRAEALERYRLEYENRGTANQIASKRQDEGYDELDALD